VKACAASGGTGDQATLDIENQRHGGSKASAGGGDEMKMWRRKAKMKLRHGI